MKRIFYILAVIAISISLVVSYYYGKHIPFEFQAKLLDSLRDTSAVLMTVLGIWMAVICPGLLSKLFDGERIDVDDETYKRIRSITIPLSIAALIVCFEIVLPWVALVLKQIEALNEFRDYLRCASFFIISLLCLIQLFAVLIAIIPIERIRRVGEANNIATKFTRPR